jgi:MarR-like DNA-binding transcriptional regulator SgrR of sgrS sRNA
MTEELLNLSDLANLYRCTRRHARDVITKLVGFPDFAPGSTQRNPLWLRIEVRAYLHRKTTKTAEKKETHSSREAAR